VRLGQRAVHQRPSPRLSESRGDCSYRPQKEGCYQTRLPPDMVRRRGHSSRLPALQASEIGINALLERLYKDMRMSGSSVEVIFGGDLAWNEWLKKRAIVDVFGRSRIGSVVPQLISLVGARSRVQQFYEILQPAAAKALGEIGDKQAIEPLRKCLRNDDVSNTTKTAIGEALERLEGQPVLDPALIIAKADKMDGKANGEEVLQLLAQIDSLMFDSLTERQKYYVWYMRGLVYKYRGDKVKAIDCFQTSLKYFSAPTAVAHAHLAELESR